MAEYKPLVFPLPIVPGHTYAFVAEVPFTINSISGGYLDSRPYGNNDLHAIVMEDVKVSPFDETIVSATRQELFASKPVEVMWAAVDASAGLELLATAS